MLIALATASFASDPVISASGGWDLPIDQAWAGVEVDLQPARDHGLEPIGRLAAQYGPIDGVPFGTLEFGAVARVPEDEAVLRAGLLFRLQGLYADYRLPIQWGDPRDQRAFGIVPGMQGIVEFAWKPEAPLSLGFRAGPQSTVSDAYCEDTDDVRDDRAVCLTWHVGVAGGFEVRKTWKSGLNLRAMIGTTSELALGWRL